MAKKKIKIEGLEIRLEPINDSDYVSLTDMARNFNGSPTDHIRNWLRTGTTIEFLGAWEEINNKNFKLVESHQFKMKFTQNTFIPSVASWVESTDAIGIKSKSGRYGGTYAHGDIALQFATWLSPRFYVFLIKEFQRLKEEEFQKKNLEWHVSKITDNVEEIRNLLDTIPGQKPDRNRLQSPLDED